MTLSYPLDTRLSIKLHETLINVALILQAIQHQLAVGGAGCA